MASTHFRPQSESQRPSVNQQDIQPFQSPFYIFSLAQNNLPLQQQPQEDQYFVNDHGQILMQSIEDSPLYSSPTLSQPDMEYIGLPMSSYQYPVPVNYYGYTSSTISGNQTRGFNGTNAADIFPRDWQQSYDQRIVEDVSSDVASPYPGREQSQALMHGDRSLGDIDDESSQDFALLKISPQPLMRRPSLSPPIVPSCKVEEDEEEDIGDGSMSPNEDRSAEEPYAKLIHRALMGAPNHAMALQEIYQWFIDNTDKGNANGSGWRNSIRHNLSMNAAFKKTDRKADSEDAKKTSEWVLESWAVENGVTPTTRYRKNISKKSSRTENPAPLRVMSGRKGGISAGKTKSQRLRPCLETVRQARKSERRKGHQLNRSQVSSPRSDFIHRHMSPTTPTAGVGTSTSSPYYLKSSPYDSVNVFDTTDYSFSNVHGVYADDGPIFCDGLPRFVNEQDYMWPSF